MCTVCFPSFFFVFSYAADIFIGDYLGGGGGVERLCVCIHVQNNDG